MKENPAMKKVIQNMKPGVISLHGFLGSDRRSIEDIIDHDRGELERLGVDQKELAAGLMKLLEKALEGFGEYIKISDLYSVRAESVRGKLPCPFTHPGLFRKTMVTVRDADGEDVLSYSELGIHLIEEHCFFQGKGSPFRIEPQDAVELINSL